jgi:hypothetical protein
MKKSRQDGLYLLLVGIAAFVLFAVALRFSSGGSMIDFKMVYHRAGCLVQGCDPYLKTTSPRPDRSQLIEPSRDALEQSQFDTIFVYLPAALPFVAPFAMLSWWVASSLWMLLTGASLILAACLLWNSGAIHSSDITGVLIAIWLANCAVVEANGNMAGIVVGLCIIAVWCLLKERFVPAGIVCLAVGLAIKPHDAGLIWLFFLLAGGVQRKRALQTLAVTAVLGLSSVLWVSAVAPNWVPELRSNLAEISTHGSFNDPGPDGLTSKHRNLNVITDLQAAVSTFKDDPQIYNPASYLVCGVLLAAWSIATLRSRYSQRLAWFALATAAPLTMLVSYHRAYDAKILLLTIPACAILWAEGGAIGRMAFLVNLAGLVFTGEISLGILFGLTDDLHINTTTLAGKIETVLLDRSAPLVLLAMSLFYLWIYLRRAGGREDLSQTETPSPVVP